MTTLYNARTAQSQDEILRDVRIMARQGKSFEHIRSVLGVTAERLRTFCAGHGIVIADTPAPQTRAAKRVVAEHRPGTVYPRKPAKDLRSVNILFQTTAAVEAAVQIEAKERNVARSRLLHQVMAAITARDLWPIILDSNSSSVASASQVETKQQEQQ